MPSPLTYPWSIHGFIKSYYPPGYYDDHQKTYSSTGFISRGTGTLIGEDTLITAAHCLYQRTEKGYVPASKVLFIPDIKSQMTKEDIPTKIFSAPAVGFYGHPAYLDNDDNYDFGIVKLGHSIGYDLGWASLSVLKTKELEQLRVNVTGYPASKGFFNYLRNRQVYDMYTMAGPITSVKKNKFYYQIDTSGGQSGAGVWALNEADEVECFGVHVTGSENEGNGATRITPEIFQLVQEWRELFPKKSDPFQKK
ncbi:MAG: trypsin-like serine peptidase [Janthinobacterium lividum]